MDKKRPTALLVFCILSWFAMGLELQSTVSSLITGPMSDEEVRTLTLTMLEGQNAEAIELMGWFFEEIILFFDIVTENFLFLNLSYLFIDLLGVVAVFLMFNMKRVGYPLYIAYSVLAVFLMSYLFSGLSMGIAAIIFSSVISVVFILLYGSQLKRMK